MSKKYIRNITGHVYDTEKEKFYHEDYEGKPIDYNDEVIVLLNNQHETIERYQHIIKTSIETERTALGQSVLKQLADALDIEI